MILSRPGRFTKPPPGAQINWGHPLATGLTACFLLNTGSGSADDFVYGYRGTLTNGARWVISQQGHAVDFDGVNQFISIPHTSKLMFPSSFTIVARILLNAAAVEDDVIVSKTLAVGSQTGYFFAEHNGATTIDFGFYNGVAYKVANGATGIGTNTWATVAGVFDDNADTNTVFLNGVQDGQVSSVGNVVSNTNAVEIGSKSNELGKTLDGQVAWVYLFDIAKTRAEIQWLNTEPYAFLLSASPSVKYFLPTAVGAQVPYQPWLERAPILAH